jgi:hypothetical protein
VVTMGMPSVFYRLWFLSHGIAGMRRSILRFAGISPVRETLFGMVAGASNATRAKWHGLDKCVGWVNERFSATSGRAMLSGSRYFRSDCEVSLCCS